VEIEGFKIGDIVTLHNYVIDQPFTVLIIGIDDQYVYILFRLRGFSETGADPIKIDTFRRQVRGEMEHSYARPKFNNFNSGDQC
jgi:hypothetical protein